MPAVSSYCIEPENGYRFQAAFKPPPGPVRAGARQEGESRDENVTIVRRILRAARMDGSVRGRSFLKLYFTGRCNMVSDFRIGGDILGLNISASQIAQISRAPDHDHIGSRLSQIWDRLVDWFAGTHRAEAKELLFTLCSDGAGIEEKYRAFQELRDLAGIAHKGNFVEATDPGFGKMFVIRAGREPIAQFVSTGEKSAIIANALLDYNEALTLFPHDKKYTAAEKLCVLHALCSREPDARSGNTTRQQTDTREKYKIFQELRDLAGAENKDKFSLQQGVERDEGGDIYHHGLNFVISNGKEPVAEFVANGRKDAAIADILSLYKDELALFPEDQRFLAAESYSILLTKGNMRKPELSDINEMYVAFQKLKDLAGAGNKDKFSLKNDDDGRLTFAIAGGHGSADVNFIVRNGTPEYAAALFEWQEKLDFLQIEHNHSAQAAESFFILQDETQDNRQKVGAFLTLQDSVAAADRDRFSTEYDGEHSVSLVIKGREGEVVRFDLAKGERLDLSKERATDELNGMIGDSVGKYDNLQPDAVPHDAFQKIKRDLDRAQYSVGGERLNFKEKTSDPDKPIKNSFEQFCEFLTEKTGCTIEQRNAVLSTCQQETLSLVQELVAENRGEKGCPLPVGGQGDVAYNVSRGEDGSLSVKVSTGFFVDVGDPRERSGLVDALGIDYADFWPWHCLNISFNIGSTGNVEVSDVYIDAVDFSRQQQADAARQPAAWPPAGSIPV